MARPEDMRKAFKRNMNRLRLSDSLDLIKYTFALLLVLVGVVAVVAFVFGKPAKTKQVAVQPTRVVKQVVYRAPKPLTPAEQTAEVENIFATVITDKINKNIKGVKFKTNITKDGWSEKVIDKKDNIQLKIGEVK
jgi:hypothetical protein